MLLCHYPIKCHLPVGHPLQPVSDAVLAIGAGKQTLLRVCGEVKALLEAQKRINHVVSVLRGGEPAVQPP